MIPTEALISIGVFILLVYSGALGRIAEGIGGLIEGKGKVDIATFDRSSLETRFRTLKRVQGRVLSMTMSEELGFSNQIDQELMEMRSITDDQLVELLKQMNEQIEKKRIVKGIFAIIFLLILLSLFS